MEVKLSIPNIPRLEIVKVLPSISAGVNFLFFARSAKSFISLLISGQSFEFAYLTSLTALIPQSTVIINLTLFSSA